MLECHLKGPQWLEIRNIQTRTAKVSTCQCEFVLPTLGKNISILPTSSLPPLRVVSLSLATFTPPNSNHAEIYSAAAMVYDGIKVDQATDAKNQSPATSCCVQPRITSSNFVVDPTRQAVSSPVREDPRSESTASCAGANRSRAGSCLAEVRELDGSRSRGGPQHHRRRFIHAPVQLPATQTLLVGDGASPIQTAASPVPAQRSRDEAPLGAIGGGYLHVREGIDPRRQLFAACVGREVHVHPASRAE